MGVTHRLTVHGCVCSLAGCRILDWYQVTGEPISLLNGLRKQRSYFIGPPFQLHLSILTWDGFGFP